MKQVEYESLALDYEISRGVELLVYPILSSLLAPIPKKKNLDFGCDTGNYLKVLIDMKQEYDSKVPLTQTEGYTFILLKKGGI